MGVISGKLLALLTCMEDNMNKIIKLALVMGLIFIIPVWGSQDLPDNDIPSAFDDAKVIRVKYAVGDAFVEREQEEGWEDLIENLPVFEGDFLTTEEGRVELYLGRLNHLRMDNNSRLEIVKAPALRSTFWTIELVSGSIILDLHQLDVDTQASVRTPDCEVFFVSPGVYRINHYEAGDTQVVAIAGTVKVFGDQDAVTLSQGQQLLMNGGEKIHSDLFLADSEDDDFMEFHLERIRGDHVARTIGSKRLNRDLEEYEPEMSHQGRWEYSPVYSTYIWYPYGLGTDWQPYLNGRWTWHPIYGYLWVSYDPCGWVTHHYGRWHWHPGNGWYWIPGYQWSPAWVQWGWENNYYCWAPLGHDNRPVIVINKRWLRDYNHRQGLPTKASSVVVVHRDHIRSGRISELITRKIGSDLIEDRLHFHGRAPSVLIHDPLLHGRTRSGKVVLIKQNSVRRTQVDGSIPAEIHRKTAERPSMDDSLRSVRKVIRQKEPTLQTDPIDSSSGSSRQPAVIKKSGSSESSSSGGSNREGSESKKVIKKKK